MTDTQTTTRPNRHKTHPPKKLWHFTPDVPIQVSPLFRWPLKPIAIVKWLIRSWLPLTERGIILLIAIATSIYFHPSLEQSHEFTVNWMTSIYLRNLLLMCLVAGGLHIYFYVWRTQGDAYRYDTRPFARNNRTFLFKSQVYDNMFWTCISGVTIWSAYEILLMWSLANKHLPSLSILSDWQMAILFIFLLPAWETLHFFLIHRLIHWMPLYRRIHALHHRNTNVGPWSGLSMHPLEHLIYFSSVWIHLIIPSHPLLIIFHLQYFALSAATTHTGYAGIVIHQKMWLPLGTFHHQLHHRLFECNYGGLEIPLDKWVGSFHDGTDGATKRFHERRKSIYSRKKPE